MINQFRKPDPGTDLDPIAVERREIHGQWVDVKIYSSVGVLRGKNRTQITKGSTTKQQLPPDSGAG